MKRHAAEGGSGKIHLGFPGVVMPGMGQGAAGADVARANEGQERRGRLAEAERTTLSVDGVAGGAMQIHESGVRDHDVIMEPGVRCFASLHASRWTCVCNVIR